MICYYYLKRVHFESNKLLTYLFVYRLIVTTNFIHIYLPWEVVFAMSVYALVFNKTLGQLNFRHTDCTRFLPPAKIGRTEFNKRTWNSGTARYNG